MEESELPAGWAKAMLADLGQWTSGGTPSKKRPDYHNGDIPWVLTGDLDDGPVKNVPNGITDAGLKNSSAKIFPPGTLLMAMYGATIGKLGVLQREAATNQACAALLPSEANQEALSYVYFFLRSQREQFKKAGKGGAQPNISQGVIKETSIPVAPLPEQQRIVEKIETLFAELDKGEEALRAVQKLLARYRQSVLKAAVTGTLTADWRAANPPTETGQDLLTRILKKRRKNWQGRSKYKEPVEPNTDDLPELPEGWAWASLESLADHNSNSIVDGPFGSKLKSSHYQDSGVRVIRLENIGDGDFRDKESFISEAHADELDRHSAMSGDLVIASLGTELPKACVVPDHISRSIVKADCIRFRPFAPGVEGKFILNWLNSWTLRQRVASEIRGVGRPRLNLKDIRAFPVPLPPRVEQSVICERVIEAEMQIARLIGMSDKEQTRSSALRQSILKDAFSGKLIPQDPSDEPAAKLLERIRAAPEATRGRRTKATA